MTCALCGHAADPVPGSPSLRHCGACGLVSLASFPAPADREASYQEEYYEADTGARFVGLAEKAVAFFRRLRMRAILRRLPGPGAILDVGCGRGIMLGLFRDRGWTAVGTQLSRTAAEAARRRGIDVRVADLPDLGLPAGSFDVVTLFHVLEHLPRPADSLRCARALLRDGGWLIVEVPNYASPGFRFLGERNLCYDYPNHLVFFTPGSLRRLLAECGFETRRVSHFSLEYSAFTTLQNLLNALPGTPNRFYRALMRNADGNALRKEPATWLHAALAVLLSPLALILALAGLLLPVGNTMRFYCRKTPGGSGGPAVTAPAEPGPAPGSPGPSRFRAAGGPPPPGDGSPPAPSPGGRGQPQG